MPKEELIVDSVIPMDHKEPLIMVNFESGNDIDCDKVKLGLFKDSQNANKYLCIAKNGNDYHHGHIVEEEDTLCRTFLVVKKKKDNKVRLVEVSKCKLQMTEPQKETEVQNTTIDEAGHDIAVRDLATKFGSKKFKRVVNASSLSRINVTPHNAIATAVSGIDVVSTDLLGASEMNDVLTNIKFILPPRNEAVKKPLEVYNVKDIISDAEFESLKPFAQFLIENPPSEVDSKYSFFMTHHYNSIGASNMTIEKMIIMIYIDSMFNFISSKSFTKSVSSFDSNFCVHSKLVNMNIIKKFTTKRIRTSLLLNKAVCYTLVLIAILSDNEIYFDVISTYFVGIHVKKLSLFLRCIGALPATKNSSVYKINVPLPALPQPSVKKINRM